MLAVGLSHRRLQVLPESHLYLERGHNGLLQRTVHPHLHLHFTAGQLSPLAFALLAFVCAEAELSRSV